MKLLNKYLGALSLALLAGSVQAVPLSDLFAGSSIFVGDKLFADFTELNNQLCPLPDCISGGIDASLIDVTGVGDGSAGNEYGLRFTSNGAWNADGDLFLDHWFGYSVEVTDPTLFITGAVMTGFGSASGDSYLGLVEKDIFNYATGDHLAFMEIYDDPFDGIQLGAQAGFGSQSKIWVQDNVFVDGFEGFMHLDWMEQRFLQSGDVEVPEPATLMLLILGLLGMWYAGRARGQAQTQTVRIRLRAETR